MKSLRGSWIFLEGLFFIFALYLGNVAAMVMFLLLLFIPLGSAVVNLLIRNHLEIQVEAGISVQKGAQGTFLLQLQNQSVLPMICMRCLVQMENRLNGEICEKNVFTWLRPKETRQFLLQTGSHYCGRIQISVPYVQLYDYFGVLGIKKRCDVTGTVTVLPETFDMELHLVPAPNRADDSEIYSQERPGMDLSEIYQIREYVAGDSLRQIHWKLSNKFDRLIVRDPSLPITRNVLIFWERTGESDNPEIVDAQAEVLVSLCRNLLEQSIQFTVGWNDTKSNQCIFLAIHDMDEFLGMLPRILQAKGAKEGISGAELLIQTEENYFCGHLIYLAKEPQSSVMELKQYGKVSVLLCGKTPFEDALFFDEKNYKEQFTQIEL